jgi:hypothetical protein
LADEVAVKRIAAVEVDPESSHQHEFNAGRLRVALGFSDGRSEGRLRAVYYGGPTGSEPEIEVGRYTLYDARESHATRSEYRLYYDIDLISAMAAPGDLLLLFSVPGSNDLRAVIAEVGSDVEQRLLDAIFTGDEPTLEAFQIVAPPVPNPDTVDRLTAAMAPRAPEGDGYRATTDPLYSESLAAGNLPSGALMAEAGQRLARAVMGDALSSDERLTCGLDAETELYTAITHELGERKLKELVEAQAGFQAVASYAMQVSQSARSRRGSSLQWHLAAVLDAAGISYTSQCTTEAKEKPDFVVPGCAQYHDDSFPQERLRMVACKSTVKERWRQILTEAERIPEKYLLTVDPSLTDDTISAMNLAMLRPFVPSSVMELAYASRPSRSGLGTVSDLVDALRASY